MEQHISDCFYELFDTYLKETSIEQIYFPCDEINAESLIEDNQRASDEADAYEDDWKYSEEDKVDIETMVDDLFSIFENL